MEPKKRRGHPELLVVRRLKRQDDARLQVEVLFERDVR